MKFKAFLVALLAANISFGASLLTNTRENGSHYIGKSEKRKLKKLYKKANEQELHAEFNSIFDELNPKDQGCSFTVLEKVKEVRSKFSDINKSKYNKSLLHSLRETNLIDDIALGILLKANQLELKNYSDERYTDDFTRGFQRRAINSNQYEVTLKHPIYTQHRDEIINQLESFHKKLERKTCLDESFSALFSSLKKFDDDFDTEDFKLLTFMAFKQGHITSDQFDLIESARRAELQDWRLTLKSYIKKRSFIRRQLDDEDGLFLEGYSSYVTGEDKKDKRSRRERLFEDYDEFQLFLLGKVIQKFRFRMENTDLVTINMINEDGEIIDSVNVDDPMDQFRLYLRLLRVEMNSLAENQVFRNRIPRYSDLITAAFELGYVPAEEVDEVAKLEEIWNPKQTRWEKVWYWVKTFGRVGTVFIPPPYGYMASMAFVAIEQLFMNDNDNNNFDHSLFVVQ